MPRKAILPRSEDTTSQTFQSTARHPSQYHHAHYSPFPTASAHYDRQTQPFPKVISKDIKSGALDNSLRGPKQNIVSWDSANEENVKDFGASDVFGATLDSTTSNDDLRAIEEGMERLLSSETEETIKIEPMEGEEEFEYGKLKDSGKRSMKYKLFFNFACMCLSLLRL